MITFSYASDDKETVVTYSLTGPSALPEVIKAFEDFLLAAGYRFPNGIHIGFEEDEDTTV